jgi:hypothetical protein
MPPCAATVWLRVGNSLVMHLQQGGDGKTGYLKAWLIASGGRQKAAGSEQRQRAVAAALTLC